MASEQPPTPPPKATDGPRRGRRRRRVFAAAAVVLTAVGIALIAVGCASSRPGPAQPTESAAGSLLPAEPPSAMPTVTAIATPNVASTTVTSPPARSTPALPTRTTATKRTTSPAPKHTAADPVLPASRPTRLVVPAIGVNSALITLGLNPDGTVQVPPLNDPHSKAGWYTGSPTPGALGPAVILGHVDSARYGPGVFYRLGKLRPGDRIDVTRADGTVAEFRVDTVRSYPKDAFPTLSVYGNIDHAGLRLITCGGHFDPSKRSYESNIVAYAELVSSHRAG